MEWQWGGWECLELVWGRWRHCLWRWRQWHWLVKVDRIRHSLCINRLKLNNPLMGRAVRDLNWPHVLTPPYGVTNMCQIWKDFVRRCILDSYGFACDRSPKYQGCFLVWEFLPLLPAIPWSCLDFYIMCQLCYNFRTQHPSVIVRTGAECRLNKAEYQQWTMKPALIDHLKGF